MKLIAGLDIRRFFEHRHQFRQVEELRKTSACTVSGAFGLDFVKRFSVTFSKFIRLSARKSRVTSCLHISLNIFSIGFLAVSDCFTHTIKGGFTDLHRITRILILHSISPFIVIF